MVDLSTLTGGTGSPEELVSKALTSQTTSVAAQTLNAEQVREFVRLVVSEQVGLNDSRVYRVNGPSLEISNIDIPDGQYAMGLGYTDRIDAADEVTPVFDQRVLAPQPLDVRLAIEQTALFQDNLEGNGIQQTADEILATYVGNIMEDEAWNANSGGAAPAGYGTGAMTTIDGWFQTALQAGHAVDFNGARMSTEIFREMLQAMPTKWRGDNEVYYVSSDMTLEWAKYLEVVRATQLGDVSITDDGVATYQGRPIIPVPKINDDYSGLNALSGSDTGYTMVLLTRPDNKAIGYSPEMRVYIGMRDDGKVAYINYWGRFDVDFVNTDRVVVGYNITPLAQCEATSLRWRSVRPPVSR